MDLMAGVLALLLLYSLCSAPARALSSASTIGAGAIGVRGSGSYASSDGSGGYSVTAQVYYGLGAEVDINLALGYGKTEGGQAVFYGGGAKYLLLTEDLAAPAVAIRVNYLGYRYGSQSGYTIPAAIVVSKLFGYVEPYGILSYNITGGFFGLAAGVEYPININLTLDLEAGYDYAPLEGVFSAGLGLEYVF